MLKSIRSSDATIPLADLDASQLTCTVELMERPGSMNRALCLSSRVYVALFYEHPSWILPMRNSKTRTTCDRASAVFLAALDQQHSLP
uniref:Uncharacterized protein n=1 Tax=Peronospora matthiolae TaxID=2874970 RepID=A0AAV1VGM0_9STRA